LSSALTVLSFAAETTGAAGAALDAEGVNGNRSSLAATGVGAGAGVTGVTAAATGAGAAGVGAGMGAAWGAGSLTIADGTDVSPVNGFLYSLWGRMTSMVLG